MKVKHIGLKNMLVQYMNQGQKYYHFIFLQLDKGSLMSWAVLNANGFAFDLNIIFQGLKITLVRLYLGLEVG